MSRYCDAGALIHNSDTIRREEELNAARKKATVASVIVVETMMRSTGKRQRAGNQVMITAKREPNFDEALAAACAGEITPARARLLIGARQGLPLAVARPLPAWKGLAARTQAPMRA